MGKQTIQEIAKILVEKNKLTPKEANQFVAIMFEVIQQQLDAEGQVKIKGLGTFKMIRVGARESVSVRTGERVTIDSHIKITFTPDATMKDLVNKPFSQFETVILNEGVEFEDLPEKEVEKAVTIEEGVTKTPIVESPIENEMPAASLLIDVVQHDEPIDSDGEGQVFPNEVETAFIDDKEKSNSWKKTLCYILLSLVLMAVSAYGGYWYGQNIAVSIEEFNEVEDASEEEVADSIEVIGVDSMEIMEDPVVEQSVSEVKEEAQTSEDDSFWKKYEEMDVRVRTGAYHIIGTDREVKVKPGETLARIARRELGEGMSCYIEVYNDLKADAELQEGQIIKIPKLKWKKPRP